MRGVEKKLRVSTAAGPRGVILEEIKLMREAREMCSRDGDYDGEHELHRLIEEKQAKLAAAVTNESAVVDDDGASEAQSDTEESESDDGRTQKNDGAADKILRQLRGAHRRLKEDAA